MGRQRGRAVESGVGVVRWKCWKGPRRIEVARGRARPPGLGTGGLPTLVAGARREGVRVRLFSAESSVNRWVRRAEYVWVGARGCVRFDGKKGREAARGQQRAGAAHGGSPASPRSPVPTLSLSSPNRHQLMAVTYSWL